MGKKRGGPSKEKDSSQESEQPSPKKAKLDATEQDVAVEEDVGRTKAEDSMENLQLLVAAFSSDQEDQYEIFRRSTFQKSTIKKLMQSLVGNTVPQNAVIAMSGIAKVYVGEIVEAACVARDRSREEGPLQPKHIREAVRKLRKSNKIPNSRYKAVFPLR